ncbi:hypothetical protein [Anaerobium acetethylicum]|nr:hypothetical protein [Anaerobium acetethylicum]
MMHFDIEKFFVDAGLTRISTEDSWRGTYSIAGYAPRIVIHSYPGVGDVVIRRPDNQVLYVESKKGNLSKGKVSTEYGLMREAIGQLMTCERYSNFTELAVAVPHSDKSKELATRWSRLPQIKNSGIRFLLVNEAGNVLKI